MSPASESHSFLSWRWRSVKSTDLKLKWFRVQWVDRTCTAHGMVPTVR